MKTKKLRRVHNCVLPSFRCRKKVLLALAVIGCLSACKTGLMTYRNGFVLDEQQRVVGHYANGFITDTTGIIQGYYRNGFVLDTCQQVTGHYANGFITTGNKNGKHDGK